MNNCYYLSKTVATWDNAKSQCISFLAHLAEIVSIEENDWVVGTLAPTQCNDAWTRCIIFIGGNDRDNEGSFVWSSDNRTLDFYNWSPVEPNSYTVNDDCIVILYPGGEWADFGCTPTRPFLCKKPLSNL
uniref:C-type lectin domain-containing protein n=1 Tax=Magallana gigas TaxID=29159 RepID=A0A8W8IUW8_MAGGI|nr:brevican core protein-like [Crassostrea gigas]